MVQMVQIMVQNDDVVAGLGMGAAEKSGLKKKLSFSTNPTK